MFIITIFSRVDFLNVTWAQSYKEVHGRRKRGTGDASPAVEKSAGDVPPEIMIFQHIFLDTNKQICIFHHFQNKVAEI